MILTGLFNLEQIRRIPMKKKLLIIFKHSPYESHQSQDGLDVLLLASGFAFELSVLFLGEAVLQLLTDQKSDKIFRKNFNKMLSALSLFDIENIYVEQQTINNYRLTSEDLMLDTLLADTKKINSLIHSNDFIMNF